MFISDVDAVFRIQRTARKTSATRNATMLNWTGAMGPHGATAPGHGSCLVDNTKFIQFPKRSVDSGNGSHMIYIYTHMFTLWLFNIAMEHAP